MYSLWPASPAALSMQPHSVKSPQPQATVSQLFPPVEL